LGSWDLPGFSPFQRYHHRTRQTRLPVSQLPAHRFSQPHSRSFVPHDLRVCSTPQALLGSWPSKFTPETIGNPCRTPCSCVVVSSPWLPSHAWWTSLCPCPRRISRTRGLPGDGPLVSPCGKTGCHPKVRSTLKRCSRFEVSRSYQGFTPDKRRQLSWPFASSRIFSRYRPGLPLSLVRFLRLFRVLLQYRMVVPLREYLPS
jgi:hypothetical protein